MRKEASEHTMQDSTARCTTRADVLQRTQRKLLQRPWDKKGSVVHKTKLILVQALENNAAEGIKNGEQWACVLRCLE